MKRTLMVLALMAIMSGMAAATETRVATFGDASMFVDDYTDIYFLPAAALSYPRLIAAEMGNSYPVYTDTSWSYGSAAVLFSNAEQTFGVVGFDINHAILGSEFFTDAVTNVDLSDPTGWGITIPSPNNRFHMFYARKIGNLAAGLHIGWAGASLTDDRSDTATATGLATRKQEGSSSLWDINGNVSMEASENASAEVAFALKLQSFSGKYDETYTAPIPADGAGVESDGGMGLDVALRAYYGMADNFTLIPVIELGMNSIGYKTSYVDTAMHPEGGKISEFSFGGGFGANYKPADNVLLFGGLLMNYGKTTIEDTIGVFGALGLKSEESGTTIFPGFCAGLEVDLLKWLTLRAGAAKVLVNESTKTEENGGNGLVIETSSTSAPYYYGFGLGFKFGKLSIDAKLNNNSPYSLGYFMSGVDNGGAPGSGTEPITSIGMTYSF